LVCQEQGSPVESVVILAVVHMGRQKGHAAPERVWPRCPRDGDGKHTLLGVDGEPIDEEDSEDLLKMVEKFPLLRHSHQQVDLIDENKGMIAKKAIHKAVKYLCRLDQSKVHERY
jgi:hypothetical protein